MVSPCNNEWVLFNCAQVLPCYVIEVRYDYYQCLPPAPAQPLVEEQKEDKESEKDKKTRLLARVNKVA